MKWKHFDSDLRALAEKIDWRPDLLVGIIRGGVIPATMLAYAFKVRDVYSLKVRHVGSGRKVTDELVPDVSGLKILLVEDMLQTGKSMIAAKKYLEEKGAEVKTAALYTMPQSETTPDYFLREVKEVQEFPWE